MKKWIRSVRFWLLMLFPLAGVLSVLARYADGFAEWYREDIYSPLSWLGNHLTGILPFSLAEIMVLTVPIGALLYLVIMPLTAKQHRFRAFGKGVLNVICAGAVCLFLFMANCGINYFADSAGEKMKLQDKAVSVEELYRTCVYLSEQASELRTHLPEDENGVMKLSDNVGARAADCMNRFLDSRYMAPKGVMLSRGMSYLNITGIYFPFTWEANVNTDVPSYTLPSTMCHELAHVNGFMHEEDANFLAFAACIASGDRELAYSGYMMAMTYAGNALYEADTERYWTFSHTMSEAVQRDRQANNDYWKAFETPVAETAAAVNDSYLKSNAQSDGIKSYGKMVDLTVAYLKKTADL